MKIEQLTNHDFAFRLMNELLTHGVPISDIMCLTDATYCRNQLSCRGAILKRVDSENAIPQSVLNDGTSQARYYKDVFEYDGTFFLITNYWYGPQTNHKDNRTPFLGWVQRKCDK